MSALKVATSQAPDYAGHSEAQVSPLPFNLIAGNEHHGPYIVNAYGADVCDFYAMSNPNSLSVRNGGYSKPIWFTDAAANAAYMHRATNCHDELVAALRAVINSNPAIDVSRAGAFDYIAAVEKARAALVKAEATQ